MSQIILSHLTCEYKTNPMGIDVRHPRLSWRLECERRGARQTAYQITAADDMDNLGHGINLLWDSGKIESDQSIHVAYHGPTLTSAQRVFWKVLVWDELGETAESGIAWWEMGLLERGDWKGSWVAAPFFGGPRTGSPAPYLRYEFGIDREIFSARLYATAVGLYECFLNGARVGEALFTPGWTDYRKHIQYQVYDVTDLLQSGENTFSAIIGDGWGVGHIAWLGRQHYADRPQFLAQIAVTFADGSQEMITTNEYWKVTQGAVLESDMLMGESYDARQEPDGWSKTGYDSQSWWPVKIVPAPDAVLIATNGPLVKRHERIKPISINQLPGLKPRWVFDFGQNMVGWVRLKVKGERGTTVILRHAEVLNPDGTLYTTNLRTARATDHYTLNGHGEEIWEPRFTFHGFRYVEMAGFPGIPDEDSLTGVVIHSEMPAIGEFECSDPLINQLQHNIVWGQKGNFVDVPTDCPQRDERLGWTGDAQVFIRTAAFNHQVGGFFSKWTRDLEDAQYANGVYPSVAPNVEKWTIGEGGPAWADAGVICPWMLYQCYGDLRILEQRYVSMQRYIAFLSQTSREGLRCYTGYEGWHGNGDWLALDGSDGREGGTSKELIGTAFFAYSAGLLANIARLLGKEKDALRYDGFADEARTAFLKKYVHEDGAIAGGTQTSYVLALAFDLLPEILRPMAAAHLAQNIQERDNHLSTGFVGTPYINWVLSENGYLDAAYQLLKQTTWPSWLYSVTQGATTIWERWDAWTHDKGFQDAKMNSFNHYAYGAIGAWMYAVIGGINFDPQEPGYKHIIMHPHPGGGITSASATLDSMYGMIRSNWKLVDGQFDWQVQIPPNTSATVYVPADSVEQVLIHGNPVATSEDAQFLGMQQGFAVVKIQSGSFHFRSHIG